ncbi:MAG: hypothetical protein Q3996_00160 [Candidatus Saccharibacteria bacterium]|nr:hypothetical protein [Candidatus Saccharibacteria bacterium]
MKQILTGLIVTIILLNFGNINLALAEENSIDDQLVNNVKTNCNQIKIRLRQLQVSDALSRVNYGQIYESINLNVITPSNTRLVTNGIKPVDLIVLSSDYDRNLNQFRRNYLVYEEKLSILVKNDCQSDPRGFYQKLTEVRQLRQQNAALLKQVDSLARQYQTMIRKMNVNELQK